MNEANETQNEIRKDRLLIFILVIFCFVVFPAFILSYSVYRYYQTEEEQLIFDLKSDMQKMTNELRRNLSAEIYFCRLFHEFNIKEANNPKFTEEKGIDYCKKIKDRFGSGINFLVINNKGKIGYSSNPDFLKKPSKVWFDAFCFIRFNESLVIDRFKFPSHGSLNALKKILGPMVLTSSLRTPFQDDNYSLYWTDSSDRIPPSAVYCFKWGAFFVFISKDILNGFVHLKYAISEYKTNSNTITGIFYNHNEKELWTSKKLKDPEQLKNLLMNSDNYNKSYIETNNYYICLQFLNEKVSVFAILEKKNSNFELFLKYIAVFAFYCFISYPIIKYCWNTIILNIPGTASIRLKLAFLFLYASGIPLLSLGVIAHEYEIHKRMALIEEARLWSIEKLLGIEQRYSSHLKTICNHLDVFIEDWSKNLKIIPPQNTVFQKVFIEGQKYGAFDYYCIASDSPYIASEDGLFKYSGSLDSIKFDKKKTILNKKIEIKNSRYQELTLANIITKKICSDLNGNEIPSHTLSKLELIAENIIQKTFPEIIYGVIESIGHIREWGLGNKSNLTYFKLISLNNKSITDYIVILSWKPKELQKIFIDKIIPEANRNPKNFKFIAYEKYIRIFVPNSYNGNRELERFARRASEKPTEELEIIELDGEEYIVVSFSGRNLNRFSFIGLYPMKNIDIIIKNQSSLLWLLGSFCLLLSLGLAHLLTKSFISPLLTLQNGALAIENRNFKHRLTGLATDEFGEVGGIFNHVMVGLEELEIAKIVQESMFPKPDFSQGKFSVYGKSVTMIDVGGDYLDFFKINDNSFAVLLGDVAGHGVGAAVIMAMAKAAILGGNDLANSPASMLNSLHKMILATKNAKQRKIMTFQYMYVNSQTGENLYSNAGACSPWLIRHSENSVQEIKMAGAALGAFKKAVYKEMPIDFRPGDAIVFYTDGIVECKNKKGEMLGYDRLKTLLLNCWDSNPEQYYNNIYKAYIDYVGTDAEAGDDLTFVILMYNKQDVSLRNED